MPLDKHFTIWIVTPPHLRHAQAMFADVAEGLRAAFAALGYDAPIVTEPEQVRDYAVVLAPQLLPGITKKLPRRMILYNLEQVHKGSKWFTPQYVLMLRNFPVWDYSMQNIEQLQAFGVKHAALCGVGYMPVLSRIAPVEEDIDVLFYGTMNERRQLALKQISRGANVVATAQSFGAERDGLIARAKIVLNLHFYESQVFEIVRVSYLLANRKCVVSETGFDAALEAPLSGGVAFAPYNQLTDTCLKLLAEPAQRTVFSEGGYRAFSAQSQVPMLERALSTLTV